MARLSGASFRKCVLAHYKRHGRDFSWRRTKNSYHILVSEIMLQQTQTARVAERYESFLKKFPTMRALARARTRDILRAWQGLGYNRRALYLHRAAKIIEEKYGGEIPRDEKILSTFPGIGENTAGAIAAFAFDKPVVFVETNIRTVFLHHFFSKEKSIHDAKIIPCIKRTLPKKGVREWYSALMDYGVYLKSAYPNPSRRSAHHAPQKKFKGSDREIRGALVRASLQEKSLQSVKKDLSIAPERFRKILESLKREGLITAKTRRLR